MNSEIMKVKNLINEKPNDIFIFNVSAEFLSFTDKNRHFFGLGNSATEKSETYNYSYLYRLVFGL